MTQKTKGIISIAAAMFVLFTAMLDPAVSLVLAVLGLAGLGIYTIARKSSADASFHSQQHSNILKNVGMSGLPAGQSRSLIETQAGEKESNKRRAAEFVAARGRVTNSDIRELLGVSDATATRYLDELEAEGRIRQVGNAGAFVTYENVRP